MSPFESLPAAQEAIDGWVHTYNHARPHQSLGMVTPASLFRPHGPSRDDQPPQAASTPGRPPAGDLQVGIIEPPAEPPDGAATQFEVRVPPSGELTLVPGRQRVSVNQVSPGGP